MTEQRINPALWRAVADELERIASAEWPSLKWVWRAVDAAIQRVPPCTQHFAVLSTTKLIFPSVAVEEGEYRWLLRALAGALRAEADAAEGLLPATVRRVGRGAPLPVDDVWGEEVW